MNKAILLVVILSFSSIYHLQSQVDYTPFDFESSVWSESYAALWFSTEEYDVTVTGDTMVDGKNYYKLHKNGMHYSFDDMYQTYPVDSFEIDTYVGAIRENDNKQIEFLRPGFTDAWIIYDFNSENGDTILVYDVNGGSPLFAVYEFYDTIEVCGTLRNRYKLRFYQEFDQFAFWIEGVGSSAGILPAYYYFESGSTLHCYSNSNCDCFNIITNTVSPQIEDNRFNIFPNPVSHSSFRIESSNNQTFAFNIYNAQGKLIQSKAKCSSGEQIDSSNWPSGCYFLSIQQGLIRTTKKILIAH